MKIFRGAVCLLLALILALPAGMLNAKADSEVQVTLKAEFKYAEARKMLDMINTLRTGSGAWYIAENGRDKVKVKGLKKLEYDYNLERTAMQRALEAAVYFSHTRPNGSAWSTLFPKGHTARGENLAYGFGNAASAFKAFAEEDRDYSGQGHRRNMLNKKFTRIGIGAVKVNGVMYWAHSFGNGGSKGSDNNRYKANKVRVSEKILKSAARKAESAVKEIAVKVGASVSAPDVVITSQSGAKLTLSGCAWKAGSGVVKVKNGKVKGVKAGKTKLTTSAAGKSVSVPVTVSKASGLETVPDGIRGETVTIDEYETALGTEFLFLAEDDECFEEDE